ncbi:MAG: hypothetical protein U0791_12115 [Gemmataceae bacterium]
MTPETEVIACPACRHLVRVPADWLGTQVQCPECRAQFTAPIRVGDKLGEAVLLSQPDAKTTPARPSADRALWLPAFALMLLGVVSLVSNAAALYAIATDRNAYEEQKKEQGADWAEQMGQDRKLGEDHFAANWKAQLGLTVWGVVCSGASFAGGAAIALRRGYAVARLGSALAAVNFHFLCCVPGAIVGGRAWMLLGTEEGRAHFQR